MLRLRLLGVVGLVVLAGTTPASLAAFVRAETTSASLATGTLEPPTALSASVSGAVVTLTWVPTISTAATGYDLRRSATSGSGYSTVSSIAPASASATTDSPGGGTWSYVLRSVLGNWTSADSGAASSIVSTSSGTGFVSCSSNQAETGGHDNGYETTPGNACGADGALARDANSGTNTSLLCTNAGKDRHRFWGYAFGIPATTSSIDGIEVRLAAGLNNNGGTSILCVQLSPDGGVTWTGPQQVTLSGAAVATYAFGAATDTWGHAWTAAELDPATFLVRVTDVTSQPTKEFRLDGVAVQVSYTP